MTKQTLFLAALMLFVSMVAKGQDKEPEREYLFSGIHDQGGFGGIITEIGMGPDAGTYIGGGGAALFNHRWFVGGYGMGLVSDRTIRIDDARYRVSSGQGGLWLGYFFKPQKKVHVSLSTRLGWGGMQFEQKGGNDSRDDDAFFMTPLAAAEVNLLPPVKVSFGAGYRFVQGLSVEGVPSDYLSQPFLQASITFGGF